MKKILGITCVLISLTYVGVNFLKHSEKTSETLSERSVSNATNSTELVARQLVQNQPLHKEQVEKKRVLSEQEIDELHKRSQVVMNELDLLTKELDVQLENPERRKQIESQYKEFADEQNQLAIQLVKASQQGLILE